ncbi:MAG TPA: SDR family oxidoreductase [Candidatus Binataceae bacterium]|nr:SDR family oxidoreductase [Candidatus Binataceae bacterium]
MQPLAGRVALVAGATRGAGRAIALELAAAGALVYATGRSSSGARSPMNRPETIEETAELAGARGGRAIAIRVDHAVPEQVAELVKRIEAEQGGRLDILVNDVWGGDPLAQWGVPFWQHNLANGLALLAQAVNTHLITSWHAAPLMVKRGQGLILEITDGISADYRGSLFYDLAKNAVNRLALAQASELRQHGIAALALSPGFLRSEAMLENLGVTEANWRDAIAKHPDFAASETPAYIGRAVVALASDPEIMKRSGQAVATWNLAKQYGFTDVDGTQPDWRAYAIAKLGFDPGGPDST